MQTSRPCMKMKRTREVRTSARQEREERDGKGRRKDEDEGTMMAGRWQGGKGFSG